ncbi:aminotransferase class I/II-fold pyridoxal phosphate-dependent enzyme [Sporosarcina jiandibaonis]|uniref:aminotransferase class I/II-fold pyridoxal phosphate-dependent enzyme n=1 Tax=Sporosarcina jiandibaonis TaxID=2715535 RepID=UPI001553D990|nr:aminotransferase class I/II-fold pyridoxal phosphate-dependent enzyme [Sporosarcina jiandibaonis]
MINRVNERVKDIVVPGIRVFSNEVMQYKDGVNLTIGEPDFPTPDPVKQAGIEAIQNNLTGYSHNAGLLELREKVSLFFEEKYGFHYDPVTEIVITTGASEGIDSILRTILTEGDEVIMPAPIYSGYEPIVHLSGAKVVYLDTMKTDLLPCPDELEGLISEKTKAIILNYPSNPTGMTLNKEQMDGLVKVLERHDIFIISDEIYSENSFNEEHVSFASYPEIRNKLFLIHGLSKSHAMTGWRLGYVLGPKELMEHVLKVHLYNSICAALPSQYAGIEALTNSRNTPLKMNTAYLERRDYVYERLTAMGLSVIKPTGAFYIFPSIDMTGLTSWDFATKLLDSELVAVVPGSTFTTYGEGFIRISYANSMENLVEGMDRIERFIKVNC